MKLEKTGSSALVEQAAKYIDELIGTAQLQPGDAISETQVSSALSMGRVPVREAIRILAGEGVLELVPNKSARVRRVDPVEILERFEMLSWLAACAMERLVAEEQHLALADKLGHIARRIAQHGRGIDAVATLREINRFHAAIIQGSGSAYLLRLAKGTRMNHYTRAVVTIFGHHAINAGWPKYIQMAEALARGDGVAATRILLRRSRKVLSDYRSDRRQLGIPTSGTCSPVR